MIPYKALAKLFWIVWIFLWTIADIACIVVIGGGQNERKDDVQAKNRTATGRHNRLDDIQGDRRWYVIGKRRQEPSNQDRGEPMDKRR